jgi:hypothetical protein
LDKKERIAAAILLSRVAKTGPRHNRKQNKEEVHSEDWPACFPVWLINFLFHFSTNSSTSRKFAIDMTGFFYYFIQDSCETGYCLQCKIPIKVPV